MNKIPVPLVEVVWGKPALSSPPTLPGFPFFLCAFLFLPLVCSLASLCLFLCPFSLSSTPFVLITGSVLASLSLFLPDSFSFLPDSPLTHSWLSFSFSLPVFLNAVSTPSDPLFCVHPINLFLPSLSAFSVISSVFSPISISLSLTVCPLSALSCSSDSLSLIHHFVFPYLFSFCASVLPSPSHCLFLSLWGFFVVVLSAVFCSKLS